MDISAGTVPAVFNLTGRMDPRMKTNIKAEYVKSKYVHFSTFNCFTVMLKIVI